MSGHEQGRKWRKDRAAMDLLEAALAAEGDPAALIAGAPEPRATRRLALGMLAVEPAAGAMLDQGAAPGRSSRRAG